MQADAAYGSRIIDTTHKEWQGGAAGIARIRRLMESGLAGGSRRKAPRTTRRDAGTRPAPDLVQHRFQTQAPDQLWVADIASVPLPRHAMTRKRPHARPHGRICPWA